ncbi:uncharacterized protein Triagg1_5231 [Trichoderma aggressivum f. europaeum]|uniref:Uncharacterized protein n=1 Tax=Trichoderma aggressivum f. europaeum TaxID=173218 RepID=A0AAE1LYM5_9HYPO|nr:hypothetical protein Triagg1_5231 [Trichoderma aggressivum f. europaeum]
MDYLEYALRASPPTGASKKSFDEVELESILRFVIYSALVTPPNYKWQEFLERKFPSRTPIDEPSPDSKSDSKSSEKLSQAVVKDRLNLTNTAIKFILDQSISAPLNTVAFLYLMGGMAFQSNAQIWSNIQNDFWPMLIAGYRVWPLVGLLNLSVVPFDYRQLVGSTAEELTVSTAFDCQFVLACDGTRYSVPWTDEVIAYTHIL